MCVEKKMYDSRILLRTNCMNLFTVGTTVGWVAGKRWEIHTTTTENKNNWMKSRKIDLYSCWKFEGKNHTLQLFSGYSGRFRLTQAFQERARIFSLGLIDLCEPYTICILVWNAFFSWFFFLRIVFIWFVASTHASHTHLFLVRLCAKNHYGDNSAFSFWGLRDI